MLEINKGVKSQLTIIKEIERASYHPEAGRVVMVKCSCGVILERPLTRVRSGRIRMCPECGKIAGKRKAAQVISERGGKIPKRLQSIFSNMKTRCYHKKGVAYERYGKRGIAVCAEWVNSARTFADWALKNGYSDGLSLDRRDNDGNYSPDNCRWTTHREQALNSRVRKDSATGVRCVTPLRGKFQLTIDGIYHGVFGSISEAVCEREIILQDNRIR